MHGRCARGIGVLAVALGLSVAAPSQELLPRPQSCETLPESGDPFAGRAEALRHYERLSASCLQAIFLQCNALAGRQLVDLQNAARCSIAYEALLKQGFSGDFEALMAWWRSTRHPVLP